MLPVSFCFSHPGLPTSGQAYPSSGLPMALSPSGNQPQYNPHTSHSSHQPSLPATNPQYHGNQGMVHSNQVVMATHTNPRPQSARCLLQTKGQKSTDGFQEQVSVWPQTTSHAILKLGCAQMTAKYIVTRLERILTLGIWVHLVTLQIKVNGLIS